MTVLPTLLPGENVDAGKYYLSAKVTDNDGMSSSSSLVTIYVDDLSNLGNQVPENIALYPNPVSDVLILNMSDKYSGNIYLTLYNSQGKIMMKETVSGNENILDLKALQPGIYFITLTSKQGSFTRKFIKN